MRYLNLTKERWKMKREMENEKEDSEQDDSFRSPLPQMKRREISMRAKIKQILIGGFAAMMLMTGVVTMTDAQTRVVVRRPPRVVVYRPYNPFWYRRYDPFWDPFYTSRYTVVDPIAYQREQGYRDGRDDGKSDAKKGRPANPTGNKDYLKSGSLTYREAFVRGYNERYREESAEIREKIRDKGDD